MPWSALGQAPVEVRMDRLFLLAKPRDEADKASIKTAVSVLKGVGGIGVSVTRKQILAGNIIIHI